MEKNIFQIYIDSSTYFNSVYPKLKIEVKPQHEKSQTIERVNEVQTVPFIPNTAGSSKYWKNGIDWASIGNLPFGQLEILRLEECLQFKAWENYLLSLPPNELTKNMTLRFVDSMTSSYNKYIEENINNENKKRIELAETENSKKMHWHLERINRIEKSIKRKTALELIRKVNGWRKEYNRSLRRKSISKEADDITVRLQNLRLNKCHTIYKPKIICMRETRRLEKNLDEIYKNLRAETQSPCVLFTTKAGEDDIGFSSPTATCLQDGELNEINRSKLFAQVCLEGRAIQTEVMDEATETSSSSMVSYTFSDDDYGGMAAGETGFMIPHIE